MGARRFAGGGGRYGGGGGKDLDRAADTAAFSSLRFNRPRSLTVPSTWTGGCGAGNDWCCLNFKESVATSLPRELLRDTCGVQSSSDSVLESSSFSPLQQSSGAAATEVWYLLQSTSDTLRTGAVCGSSLCLVAITTCCCTGLMVSSVL